MHVSRYITASFLHSGAVLLLCTVCVLPAAAQDRPSSPPGQPPKTVELGELGQQVRVSLKVGDRLRVVLHQLPKGFKWQIARNDNVILEATSSESTQPDGQGSVTGIQNMVFTEKSVGRDDLVLNYVWPLQSEKPPLRTYTVAVTVK
jgi:predicted secreted protein